MGEDQRGEEPAAPADHRALYQPSVPPTPRPSREEAEPEAAPRPVEPAPEPRPAPAPVVQEPPQPEPTKEEPGRASVVASLPDPGSLPLSLPLGPTLKERIALATTPSLRTRRMRIEARIFELSRPVGEAVLEIEGIRRTKNVDLDRVLKKIDKVDDAIFELEEGEPPREGILGKISQVPARLSDKVELRELRTKRSRLVSELGQTVLFIDLRSIRSRAPGLFEFAQSQAEAAREVDQLFRQARLVEDELDARARDGRDWKEPKVIDRLVSRTGEVVDDVSDRAAEKLKGFGKTAAKAAAKGTWSLARGAFEMGKEKVADRASDDDGDEEEDRPRRRSEDEDEDDDRPRRRARRDKEASGAGPDDVADRLRKLAKLHDEGLLTDDEYARKREELLRKL